jgi:hypothetical protein
MSKFVTKLMAADKKTVLRQIDAEYDFGANLAQFVKKHGEAVAHALIEDAGTVRAQQYLRTQMKKVDDAKAGTKRLTERQILENFTKEFKLEIGRKPADPQKRIDTIQKLLASLSPEERAKALGQGKKAA